MGQLDMAEKLLEDYNDVFADIVNVLLFNGKQVINPEHLKDTNNKSQYKAESGKLHEMERDVSKIWESVNIQIALFGFENQTKVDKDMPFRIIGYDGNSYRWQLQKENYKKKRMPVLTLVLYFGKQHWKHPHNIKGLLEIPDELQPYVNDYKANIFEIAWLPDEKVKMFKSDFRIVADYFVQSRMKKTYVPDNKIVEHVDEFLKLMRVLTGDDRYNVTFDEAEKERGIQMCNVMDKAEEKGRKGMLFELVMDGMLNISDAAKKALMSEDDFLCSLEIWKKEKKNL